MRTVLLVLTKDITDVQRSFRPGDVLYMNSADLGTLRRGEGIEVTKMEICETILAERRAVASGSISAMLARLTIACLCTRRN